MIFYMDKKRIRNNWQISKYFIFRCAGFPFELIESLKFPRTIKAIKDLSQSNKKAEFDRCGKIFEEEFYEKRLTIQKIASLPKFQEAIFLQDSDAHQSIDRFLKQNIESGRRTSKFKSRELLIYKYLQRFCTKNETVSFFGPFFIGEFAKLKNKISLVSATSGQKRRANAYTAFWFLYHIIDALEADDKILADLKPSLPPNLYFDDKSAVILKTIRRFKLDKLILAIFKSADRKINVRGISLELMKQGFSRSEIFGKIRWMFKNSLLLSGLEFDQDTYSPEDFLLKKLKSIPGAKNNKWHLRLKRLKQLKSEFEKGNFSERLKLADEVKKLFSAFIKYGYAKSRFYGRGFFTEYRELNLKDLKLDKGISANFLKSFNPILNMSLYDCGKLKDIQNGLFADFLKKVFIKEPIGVKEALFRKSEEQENGNFLFENLRNRLGLGALPADLAAFIDRHKGRRRVSLNKKNLMRAFKINLEAPSNPAATCCDCLLDAKSPDDINKGKFAFVFAESHVMRKPANIFACIAESSSKRTALRKEIAKIQGALKGKGVILGDLLKIPGDILGKNYGSKAAYKIEFDAYSRKKGKKINFSDLKIVFDKGTANLVDGKNRPVLLLEDLPFAEGAFSVLAPSIKCLRPAGKSTHFPRVKLSNLVLQREQWVFLIKDLFFAQTGFKREGLRLWLELEAWRNKHGIPKQFFLRTDNRIKPIFIDFENYLSIEAFINFIKNAKDRISIEEMLPGPQGLWFRDKNGRYTCEFRLLAYKK